MGGGGQAPASAAASMAPGGGAHAISSSPLKKIEWLYFSYFLAYLAIV